MNDLAGKLCFLLNIKKAGRHDLRNQSQQSPQQRHPNHADVLLQRYLNLRRENNPNLFFKTSHLRCNSKYYLGRPHLGISGPAETFHRQNLYLLQI
jgi:hypothetical protein